jgi:hypothetical protein
MKRYYVSEIEPLENGGYQYGVFEYEGVEDKPLIRLSRPKLIETFSHEWRAIRYMEERQRSENDNT